MQKCNKAQCTNHYRTTKSGKCTKQYGTDGVFKTLISSSKKNAWQRQEVLEDIIIGYVLLMQEWVGFIMIVSMLSCLCVARACDYLSVFAIMCNS